MIPACPKRRPVSRGTWYGISSIPNFHVCEKCFEVHIYDSAFHKYFTEFKLADGEKTYCAFNTPRVLNFVWPTTVQANLFEVFTGFATGRSKIGTCTSLDSTAKQGTWYTIQGSSKGGFIACQACYEDVILASPFHKFFGALDAQVTENAISCHVAWPFIEARLLNTPSTWDEIQRDIEYRLFEVPACPGDKLIRDPGRRWWKPKGTSLPLYICDCCYWDGIFPTLFSGDFELVVQDRSAAWCCAMSGYQLSMVWQHAAEKKDLSIWLDAANAALSPMCSAQGSNGKIWNCIKDSASLDGFEFCERCTAVFIRSLGFGGRLEQRRYAPEETIKCQLHPSNEFQVLMLQKLGEAAAWREFGIFKQFLEQIASNMYKPQACPGTSLERRKRWWGCEGFNVCEDCWVRQVQPSAFAGFVKEVDLKGRSGENRCDLGTVDWKGIWKRKCEKGDFRNFLEAVELKHKLEEVRMDRAETVKEMMEKSRRGLFPDERRRLQSLLGDLEEEERDATNMLAVLTRG